LIAQYERMMRSFSFWKSCASTHECHECGIMLFVILNRSPRQQGFCGWPEKRERLRLSPQQPAASAQDDNTQFLQNFNRSQIRN
jgi:hypothetical protein